MTTVNERLNDHLVSKPKSKKFVANEADYVLIVEIDAQTPIAAYAVFRQSRGSLSCDISTIENDLEIEGIDLWSFSTDSRSQPLKSTGWPSKIRRSFSAYFSDTVTLSTVSLTNLCYSR